MAKVRKGFVSNSSSSSFVVIGTGKLEKIEVDRELVVGHSGTTEFGWDETQYSGMWSLINFAYLQTDGRPEWLEMLETVIKEHLGCSSIVWLINSGYGDLPDTPHGGYVWGYIDHQSSACEGENTEIFENADILKRFLFSRDSYIQGGNDN